MPSDASTAKPSRPHPTGGVPPEGSSPGTLAHAALTLGFGCAVTTWVTWLVLAWPSLDLAPMPIVVGVLGVWMLAAAWSGRFIAHLGAVRSGLVGATAGIVTAAVNLLLLGSKLVEAAEADNIMQGEGVPHPDWPIAVAGFFVAGALIGGIGGVIGANGPRARLADGHRWFARFTLVSVLATAPLLLLGGAVTSTESGMAVTGWPDSFGGNMFLYPFSLMSEPRVFMEHAHRLFGAMVGLTILTQWVFALVTFGKNRIESIVGVVIGTAIIGAGFPTGGYTLGMIGVVVSGLAIAWTILSLLRGSLTPAAGGLLVLVIAQGMLGGTRVTEVSSTLAIAHGVTGQVLAALAASLALCAHPGYQNAISLARPPLKSSVLLVCTLFVQLAFGATYRHLRRGDEPGASHALIAHIVLSLVVVVLAIVAGSMLAGRKEERDQRPRGAVKVGKGLGHIVALQFVLGWLAFGVIHTTDPRGELPTAEQLATAAPVPWYEALVATAHQANGALLAIFAAMAVVWSWKMRQARKAPPAA